MGLSEIVGLGSCGVAERGYGRAVSGVVGLWGCGVVVGIYDHLECVSAKVARIRIEVSGALLAQVLQVFE